MQLDNTTRTFQYNGKDLADPGEHLTPRQVAEHYSRQHPELVNASIEGPTPKDGVDVYRFVRSVGTKG